MIAARRETIFRYFTDPARFTRWMGQASVLEAEPGGRLRVGYPTGQVAAGQVVAVEPDRRIVFTWATRACHGLVRFGWAAVGPGETVLATGTSVAGSDVDGRFRWVTGFWDPPAVSSAEPPEHPEQT